MKILLIGEYSNVHWTLAEGLRTIGHNVTVLSNGDFWKTYKADIKLVRRTNKLGGVCYMLRLYSLLPRLRGYDIVQLINPMFLEVKAKRVFPIYNYLRKHNKRIVLCGFGMDYYWVNECREHRPLRYSDFNLGNVLRTDDCAMCEVKDWIGTDKERLNKYIAGDCDGIVTGLYEYWACYSPNFYDKTTFIPFPIKTDNNKPAHVFDGEKLRLFIGLQRKRSMYKGTDIMLTAAKDIAKRYSDKVELCIMENVPYDKYFRIMNNSDVILDQLYSYTPAMNALVAMSKGIICVGGGEPESYNILKETALHPIVNVQPNYESVYAELEKLVLHPELISKLKQDSIEYVRKHHDYIKVARQYEAFYQSIIG